jgi:hypothetical protein
VYVLPDAMEENSNNAVFELFCIAHVLGNAVPAMFP